MRAITLLMLACAGIYFLSCNSGTTTPKETTEISNDSLVKRGHYLVTIGSCNDCHTPKIMTAQGPMLDTNFILAGYREGVPIGKINKDVFEQGWVLHHMETTSLVTPMSVSFAANLTSDETGIGNWTFDQFKIALTKGKWKGIETNRDLLPPMPWRNYVNMQESDMKAIFAYLKSTKPVKNRVPNPIPADKM